MLREELHLFENALISLCCHLFIRYDLTQAVAAEGDAKYSLCFRDENRLAGEANTRSKRFIYRECFGHIQRHGFEDLHEFGLFHPLTGRRMLEPK